MKKEQTRLFILLCITFLHAKTFSQILVTPDNFSANGWELGQVLRPPGVPNASQDTRSQPTAFIHITCGPANPDPLLGKGSAFMSFPKTANPNLYRVILLNNLYHGKKLADITELRYSTWTAKTPATEVNPVAPVLLIQIDEDGDGPGKIINNINFFPNLQNPPATVDTWQVWNTLDLKWKYIDRTLPDPTIAPLETFQQIITRFPNATIVNTPFTDPNGGAGIRFLLIESPGFVDYQGYVDGFTIKVGTALPNIYNFEEKPATTSSEQTICKGNSTFIGTDPVPGSTYSWTSHWGKGMGKDKGFSDDQKTVSKIQVWPTRTTFYTLTETTSTGCVYVSTVKVEVRSDIICFRTGRNTIFIPNNYLIILFFIICGIVGIRYVRIHRRGNNPPAPPKDMKG